MAKQVLSRLKFLLSALCVSLAFQSCHNELETVQPAHRTATSDVVTPPTPCKSVCLVAGQHTLAGTVEVALDADYLYVTYTLLQPNVYLLETHVDIFRDLTQLRNDKKLSNGGAIPGKFTYKQSWSAASRTTSYTALIPRAAVDALGSTTFFIATHAALSSGETAWGGLCNETRTGVSLNGADQFPGNNWGVYFQFSKDACASTVDFTYAWEDLQNDGNDSDYNDLVIKSAVTREASQLEISFMASARGAGYDHAFRFNIAKTGIVPGGIYGAASVQDMGSYYTVTVFPSTKAALPPTSPEGLTNTLPDYACISGSTRTITIVTTSGFPYAAARPYEPFISVFTSGNANSGSPTYDLYIYEVSNRDTWTDGSNKVYPNGILIPANWKWPLERTPITAAYANFTSLTDGFTPTWAATLTDPTKVSPCN